jgi:hypothetical protein
MEKEKLNSAEFSFKVYVLEFDTNDVDYVRCW